MRPLFIPPLERAGGPIKKSPQTYEGVRAKSNPKEER
jgi:hypothetical protein